MKCWWKESKDSKVDMAAASPSGKERKKYNEHKADDRKVQNCYEQALQSYDWVPSKTSRKYRMWFRSRIWLIVLFHRKTRFIWLSSEFRIIFK